MIKQLTSLFKMSFKAFFLGLFCLFSHGHAATVSERIDQALIFSESRRNDLARDILSQLLRESLTPDEQTTILYNLSSLMARSDQYKEALDTINKIGPALLERVAQNSPLLAFCIAYDKAVYSLQIVKGRIRESRLSLSELESFQTLLNQAKEFLLQATELVKKVSPIDSETLSHSVMTHVAEEIAEQEQALSFALFLNGIEQLNKEALINEFLLFLHDSSVEISALFMYGESSQEANLYVEAYRQRYRRRLFAYIEQLLIFLQAPGKPLQTEINAYLIVQIESLRTSLALSFEKRDKEMLLMAISELMSRLQLVLAQVTNTDISELLEERIEVLAMGHFQPLGSPLEQFWKKQAEERKLFLSQYLEEKQRLYAKNNRPFQAALAGSFNKYLSPLETLSDVITAKAYWKALSSPEIDVLSQIVEEIELYGLQNKTHVDFLLEAVSQRLSVRLSVTEKTDKERSALARINQAKIETSSQAILQNVLDSWRLLDPNSCFTFLFKRVQNDLSSRSVSSLASDIDVLVRQLRLFFDGTKDREILALLGFLDNEAALIAQVKSSAYRQKIAFAEISLVLRSFQYEVLTKEKSFKELVKEVDDALEYQKQIINLVKMAGATKDVKEREAISQAAQLFIRWQKRVLLNITGFPDLQKRQAVKTLIEQAEKILAPSVVSLYKAVDLLEKAAKMLHQEEREKSQKKESKTLPAEEAATMEIDKKTVNLTPDMAIRLLQEMERDDMSLEEPKSREREGLRPW